MIFARVNYRTGHGRIVGMYVVCKDHVELAIDMFVDEYEDAPDLIDLEEVQFSDWTPPAHCDRCSQPARFLIV